MEEMKKALAEKSNYTFDDLCDIMSVLRSPEGCPWDREQNHMSIRKNFIEETYEVCEAIDDGDSVHLCEELGDVMLQVAFHAQMEKEKGTFNILDSKGQRLLVKNYPSLKKLLNDLADNM